MVATIPYRASNRSAKFISEAYDRAMEEYPDTTRASKTVQAADQDGRTAADQGDRTAVYQDGLTADDPNDKTVIDQALPRRRRMIVLTVMMVGTFVASLSQSMLIAALPTIMTQFSVDATLGQLLTTSYIFMLGLISATTAVLISRFNTKYLFMVAMSLFVVGCAIALVAPNYWVLLLSRLLQAGGAGVALPLIQVVALSVYPKEMYGRAMGIVGLLIGFAPAIGPTISGFMIDWWGWRSIFIILGGVVAAIIVLSAFVLRDAAQHDKTKLDVPSVLLYTIGFCCFMVGVTFIESVGFDDIRAYIPCIIGTVVLVFFAIRQFRIDEPLLKLRCLLNRTFAISTLLVIVTQIALMVGAIMVPLFVQDIQGQSASASGLTILPGAILLGFLNPVTGRLLDRFGPRPLIGFGCSLLIAGTLVFVAFDANTPEWAVTVFYGVRIAGISCLMMPMTAHGCAALPEEDLAQGTAIMTSFRQVFGAIVSSILVTVMVSNADNEVGIDVFGFGVSFEVQAAIVLFGLVVGLLFIGSKRKAMAKA